jgi:hypothetical protein
LIRDTLYRLNNDKGATIAELLPKVGTEPLIYRENTGASRKPHTIGLQQVKFRYMVNEVSKSIAQYGIPSDWNVTPIHTEPEPVKPEPVKSGREPIDTLISELDRVSDWIETRTVDGNPIDEISMRPYLYGGRMVKAGISVEAALYAMAMHWPEDTRRMAGITDAAPADLDSHIASLAKADTPILLIGPAGSGKSYRARVLADTLGIPYGECPMTGGASPSWLFGAHTIDGYKSRPLMDIYANGGVFNFEEIDGADPNMLLAVNNLMVADTFFNPVTGEEVKRHEDFRAVATANTFGTGRNAKYTGRMKLDASTLDRWRMGRVFVPFDRALAHRIARGA